MKISLSEELVEILEKIKAEKKTLKEWCEIESSDMYQTQHFNGGFDADEEEFTFSYYDDAGNEFWFQFPLNVVEIALTDPNFVFFATIAD